MGRGLGREGQTTFSLNAVYRALGLRDPRAVARIPNEVTPVIQLGSIETFAPQVIEARAEVRDTISGGGARPWAVSSIQSLSEGGAIIEELEVSSNQNTNIAVMPVRPYNFSTEPTITLGPNQVLQFGGLAVRSIMRITNGGAASLENFPGLTVGAQGTRLDNAELFAEPLVGVWVPPGWYAVTLTVNGPHSFRYRWREIPEGQGSP